MPTISAKMVMDLRDIMNLPMMKCKAALEQANGDRDAAIKILRQQFITTGTKFSGRATPEGAIGMALSGSAGALVRLGCQTDFVAKGDEFQALADQIAQIALVTGTDSVDELKAKPLAGGTVADAITTLLARIGENIVLDQAIRVSGEQVVGYNHGTRIGALVAGTNNADNKLKTIALHVASASPAPVALNRAQVDPALIAKERDIVASAPDVLAKPEALRPRIIDGKLGRFFKENVLLEQEMLLDNEQGESVAGYAARVGVTVTAFARLAV